MRSVDFPFVCSRSEREGGIGAEIGSAFPLSALQQRRYTSSATMTIGRTSSARSDKSCLDAAVDTPLSAGLVGATVGATVGAAVGVTIGVTIGVTVGADMGLSEPISEFVL